MSTTVETATEIRPFHFEIPEEQIGRRTFVPHHCSPPRSSSMC